MNDGNVSRRRILQVSAGLGAAALLPVAAAPAYAEVPQATDEIVPFRLRVPESALVDLRRRLAGTRWPEQEPVPDERQGAQLATVRALVTHWQTKYNWRRVEAR